MTTIAGEAARAHHARQAPPSCPHMMPLLTGHIWAPRCIQTFAFGAIDAPSATRGGEPLTWRIDFSTLTAPGVCPVHLTSPPAAPGADPGASRRRALMDGSLFTEAYV